MIWLLWRQHRAQTYLCLGIVAALGLVLGITGVHMAAEYHHAVAQCTGKSICDLSLFRGDGAIIDTVNLTLAAPLLFGLFWGAPLIGREIETGTHTLVWTQGVSRRRWLGGKLAVALAAAAVWGAVLSAVVTWWSGTLNSLDGDRFSPAKFDFQNLVPVAYSLFAVALGIAAGALIRRTLPALATTVAGYVGVRLIVENYARPRYLSPLTRAVPLSSGNPGGDGAWNLRTDLTLHGRVLDGVVRTPAQCLGVPDRAGMDSCLDRLGYRLTTTYQPAGRYWTFQFIEAGLFVALAAVLVGVAILAVHRRDA
jgi:hypothetical protein